MTPIPQGDMGNGNDFQTRETISVRRKSFFVMSLRLGYHCGPSANLLVLVCVCAESVVERYHIRD
jgi:hypothetical protein